jgi:hypothetical protein
MTWGMLATLTACTNSTNALIALKLFHGTAFGCFLPGIFNYMLYFYTKEEYAFRFALIIGASYTIQSASGIFAHYISFIQGYWGIPGYKWYILLI